MVRMVAEALTQSGFLRLPVYEDNPDNVIGYVHVSDVNAAQLRARIARRFARARLHDDAEAELRELRHELGHRGDVELTTGHDARVVALTDLESRDVLHLV